MSSNNNSGVPWPVWSVVTILVALIGAYATIYTPVTESRDNNITPDDNIPPIEKVPPGIELGPQKKISIQGNDRQLQPKGINQSSDR